jgi:hypothetical protein
LKPLLLPENAARDHKLFDTAVTGGQVVFHLKPLLFGKAAFDEVGKNLVIGTGYFHL